MKSEGLGGNNQGNYRTIISAGLLSFCITIVTSYLIPFVQISYNSEINPQSCFAYANVFKFQLSSDL